MGICDNMENYETLVDHQGRIRALEKTVKELVKAVKALERALTSTSVE